MKKYYRRCVGMMILNDKNEILVGKRLDHPSGYWQMPQGGIDKNENPEKAVWREMMEEIGTTNAKLIQTSSQWINYDIPKDTLATFSTLIYLLWLHNIEINNDLLARLLVLHSDATWLKYQQYPENSKYWEKLLPDYNWKGLFNRVNTKGFERRIDEDLYPLFQSMQAVSGKSKLRSKHLNICSKQFQFNPDWDEDVILTLINLFGDTLGWTPPSIPSTLKSINGNRKKVPLALIKEIGISQFLKDNRVFSYAIPSPRIFNFTSFGTVNKSPLEKKHG